MNFLYFVITGVISGIVAAATTVFLMKRHMTSAISTTCVTKEAFNEEEASTILVEEKEPAPLHEALMSVLTTEHVARKKRVSISLPVIVYTKYLSFIVSGIDAVLTTIFSLLSKVLAPIFVPLYEIINFLEKDILSFSKMLKADGSAFLLVLSYSKNFFSSVIHGMKSFVQSFFNRARRLVGSAFQAVQTKHTKDAENRTQKVQTPITHTISEPRVLSVPQAANVSRFAQGSVFGEILLSAVPAALVALPFLLGGNIIPSVLFTYLFLIALVGSMLLILGRSPRAFWAVGIALWSAIGYYFYTHESSPLSLGPAVMSMSGFLFVYALSANIWYNKKSHVESLAEYALYVLHPLIYIASLYLLIAKDVPYIASFVFGAVAILYGYFARTTHMKNKGDIFAVVSEIVAVVAVSSAIIVAVSGLFEILILLCLYGFLFYHKEKYAHFHVVTVLVFIFFVTLEQTNQSSRFVMFFNERFVYYGLAAFAFFHAYAHTRSSNLVFGTMSKNLKRTYVALGTLLLHFGITLEVLDAKIHTKLFSGTQALALLLVIYLVFAFGMFFFGKRNRERTPILIAIVLSLYSVYLISQYLL